MFLWGSWQIAVQDELDRKPTSSNNIHDLSLYLSRCLRPWFTKIRSLYHMWSCINALRFGTSKDEWLAFRNSLGIPKSSISFTHKLQWVKFTSELSDEISLLNWTSNTLFQVLSASLLNFSFWPGRWRGGRVSRCFCSLSSIILEEEMMDSGLLICSSVFFSRSNPVW